MAKKNSTINLQQTEITPMTVEHFLNTQLRDYARYVIETRALPNIMDGQRTGARKVIYAALMSKDLKSGAKLKMNSLVGKTLDLQYHHGNTSLEGTVVNLGSPHTNNITPLQIIGQIGSLRVPDSKTAARYLSIRASNHLEMFRMDIELTQDQYDDGQKVEPKFLLPIIPLALTQRTSNPGFGFSFKGFSYNVADIIDVQINVLLDQSHDDLENETIIRPHVDEINDENFIYSDGRGCWYNVGKYEIDYDKNMVRIIDLPFNVSYAKFEAKMQELMDKCYIVKFENYSQKGKLDYRVYFPIGRLKTMYNSNKWKFYNNLMLFTKVPGLNLNCIDENGVKILHYETPQDLIVDFTHKRLKYYTKRKTETIRILNERIALLDERKLFIKYVIDGVIVINRRPIKAIQSDLDKYNISYEVLKLPISRLTQDEIKKSEDEIAEANDKLLYIKSTTEKEMYINDLVELRIKLFGIEDHLNNK